MTIHILFVGTASRAEFSSLTTWVRDTLQPAVIRQIDTLADSSARLLSENWMPDLVIVLQSWPDEYNPNDVDILARLVPLARWVVCYGPWCEGDGRTRDVWPLAVRVPLARSISRVNHEWDLLQGRNVVTVPLSASREECFAMDHPPLIGAGPAPEIWVDCADVEYGRYLRELLTCSGYPLADELREGAFVLFELDPWPQRHDALSAITRGKTGCRIVGLTNWLDSTPGAALAAMGVTEVLAKLGDQQRILDAIDGNGVVSGKTLS